MNGFTVKQLKKFCEQAIANGDGDKIILLSQDDEGNGFHTMFYAFTSINDYYGSDNPTIESRYFPEGTTNETHIILG